jgi:hypothetical protein
MLSFVNGYSSSDSFTTLYSFQATLKSGHQFKGSILYLNYDTVPEYQFSNKAFLKFLSKISQQSEGKITVYSNIQLLKLTALEPWSACAYGAAIPSDVHRLNVADIQTVKFIKGAKHTCFSVITQLSQTQIDQINRGSKLIHQFNYPLDEHHQEASDLHLVIGNDNQISQQDFENQIKDVYDSTSKELSIDGDKWQKLKNLYQAHGLVLLKLYVTDYFIADPSTLR